MNDNINSNLEQNVQNNMEELPTSNTIPEPVQTYTEPPKKKRKGLKGLIIFLIIVLIIGGLIYGGIKLYKHLTYVDDPFEDIDSIGEDNLRNAIYAEEDNSYSSLGQLELDYKNKVITADQYATELLYLTYDQGKVSPEYGYLGLEQVTPTYLFSELEPIMKDLSPETLQNIAEYYSTLYNTKWDFGDLNETSSNSLYNYKVNKVVYTPAADPNYLSEVKLSRNGNFLVYYSKKGKNAITEERAEQISNHLEDVVDRLKKEYGLKYKFEAQDPWKIRALGHSNLLEKLLEKNDIDTKYLDTAMPIYVIDLEDTGGVLGYYNPWTLATFQVFAEINMTIPTGKEFFDPTLSTQTTTMATTYTFPYFVINSAADSTGTDLIGSHELFHHYQCYICGDGKYETCAGTKFITEITAQETAVRTAGKNETGTFLNTWSYRYAKKTDISLEESKHKGNLGYAEFPFAVNYEKIVKNGANKMFQAMKYENSIKYLSEQSNGKYKEVMETTAEKFLTLDYDNKLVLPTNKDGTIVYPRNYWFKNEVGNPHFFENKTFTINHSSMQYVYLNPGDYPDLNNSVYLKSSSKDVSVIFFVKRNNKYYKVYKQDLDKEFVIEPKQWTSYDQIALAIVDSSVEGTNTYEGAILSTSDKEPTITPDGLKKEKDNNLPLEENTCYQVEDNDLFKTVYQVKYGLDDEGKLNEMYIKGSIRIKNYDPKDPAFKIAKNTVNALMLGIRVKYKQMLKNVRIKTYDTGDTYTILFKVTKGYDEAFRNNFGSDPGTKEEIKSIIQSKGFICN